jgi:hypothetical protein
MDYSLNNNKYFIDNNKEYNNIINKIIIDDKLSIILPENIQSNQQSESLYISDDEKTIDDNELIDVEELVYVKELINNNEPPNKKFKKNDQIECPGCYPVYQFNQIGHTGIYGCLKSDYEY